MSNDKLRTQATEDLSEAKTATNWGWGMMAAGFAVGLLSGGTLMVPAAGLIYAGQATAMGSEANKKKAQARLDELN